MKRLLIVIVVLLVGIAGFGFYEGWWQVSVDKAKIQEDRDRAFGSKGKDQPDGQTDKAKGQQGRP